MLGDNRDNSVDSRFFGLVPREQLIGRAERILVSADYKDTLGAALRALRQVPVLIHSTQSRRRDVKPS